MAFFLEPGGRGSPRARACGGVLAALLASVAAASCGSDGRPGRLIGGSSGASGAASTGGAAGASSSGSGGDGGSAQAGAAGGGSGAGSGGRDSESCAPAQPCQRLCGVLGDDPSGCGLGTAAECGCKCEERFNGPCPDELGALVECIGDTPNLDCKVRGRVFPGCETQAFALEACDFQAREQLCALSYPLCTPYCQGAMLGFCSLGPESVASCLCGCEATLVTTCATAFDAFMTCTSNAPAFQCDGLGRLTATSCPTQWQALEGCMGSPGNVNSDAGG